jgi:hypothetical protein
MPPRCAAALSPHFPHVLSLRADARCAAPPHPRAVRSSPPIDKLQSELLVQAFLEAGGKLPPADQLRSLAIWLGLPRSTVCCWFEQMCAAQALLPRSVVAPVAVVPLSPLPPPPPPPPPLLPLPPLRAATPAPLPHLAWQCRCGATPFLSRGACHVQRSAADRATTVALRPNDWSCAACGKPNIGSRPRSCYHCGKLRHTKSLPPPAAAPPQPRLAWRCSCGAIPFEERSACHKCGAPRQADAQRFGLYPAQPLPQANAVVVPPAAALPVAAAAPRRLADPRLRGGAAAAAPPVAAWGAPGAAALPPPATTVCDAAASASGCSGRARARRAAAVAADAAAAAPAAAADTRCGEASFRRCISAANGRRASARKPQPQPAAQP